MAENQDHQRYTIVVGAGMVTVEDALTDHPPVIFQGQDRLIQAVDYAERMNNREGPDPDTLQKLTAPSPVLNEVNLYAWTAERQKLTPQSQPRFGRAVLEAKKLIRLPAPERPYGIPDVQDVTGVDRGATDRIMSMPVEPRPGSTIHGAAEAFLAGELPAFAAWQRDRARRLVCAKVAEEEAHRAYVLAVARRVVIELEMPERPAHRVSEPRSATSGPSVDTGVPRCS